MAQPNSLPKNTVFAGDRIIRKPEVKALTGLGNTSLWEYERNGNFPHRVSIGPRAVGWRYKEVVEWLNQRPQKIAVNTENKKQNQPIGAKHHGRAKQQKH